MRLSISSKKWTNEFNFTTMVPQVNLFSFVFWTKSTTSKNHFKINWPLKWRLIFDGPCKHLWKSNQKNIFILLIFLLKSTPCWVTSAKLHHWGHTKKYVVYYYTFPHIIHEDSGREGQKLKPSAFPTKISCKVLSVSKIPNVKH